MPHHRQPARRRCWLTASSLVLAGLVLLSTPEHLAACSFHVNLTGNTLSRQVADSVEIITARPSRENPFQFEPVGQLKGTRSGSTPPHLVDSVTRRQLAQNLDHTVLFARGSDGQWTRLMFLDADRRRIAGEVLSNSSSWATPSGDAGKRDYFAALLGHPIIDMKHISLTELDAMSYVVLRGGTYPVTAQDLLSSITDLNSIAFAPVRILLLGIVGGRDADVAIVQQLQGMATSGSTLNLGAWITAAIETGGLNGIGELERKFLGSDRTLSREQLVEIVRALSVHSASGRVKLRTALDDAVRRLVRRYPEAAPIVAQFFGTASDWSQVNLVRELIAADELSTRADLMAVTAYLSSAGNRGNPRRHPLLQSGLPFMSDTTPSPMGQKD